MFTERGTSERQRTALQGAQEVRARCMAAWGRYNIACCITQTRSTARTPMQAYPNRGRALTSASLNAAESCSDAGPTPMIGTHYLRTCQLNGAPGAYHRRGSDREERAAHPRGQPDMAADRRPWNETVQRRAAERTQFASAQKVGFALGATRHRQGAQPSP